MVPQGCNTMTMNRAFSLGWSLLLLLTTNVDATAAASQSPRFRKRIVHRSLRPDTTTTTTTSATAIASNDDIEGGFDWATSMSMMGLHSMSMDNAMMNEVFADDTSTTATAASTKSGPTDVPLPIEQLTFDELSNLSMSMPGTSAQVPPAPELITITSSPSQSPVTTRTPTSPTTAWPSYSPTTAPQQSAPLEQNAMSMPPNSKAAKTKPPTSSPSSKPSPSPSKSPTGSPVQSDSVENTLPAEIVDQTTSSSTATSATTTSSTTSVTSTADSFNPRDVMTTSSSTTTTATSSTTTTASTSSSVETISVETNIQLDLATMVGKMDDDATAVFEQSCDEFLNEMLSMAETPIYNVKCQEVSQEFQGNDRRRLGLARSHNGGGGARRLTSSLAVDVNVKGTATATSSVQDTSDIPFDDLVVGTFNANSPVFISQLQADGAAAEIDDFESLSSVYAIQEPTGSNNSGNIDGAKNPEGIGNGTGDNEGGMNKGIIAAIVACGTVVVAMFGYGLYAANQRRRSARSLNNDELDNDSLESEFEQDTYMNTLSGMVKNAKQSLSMDESAADNQLIIPNNTTAETQNNHGETLTYMYSLEDGLASPQSLMSHNIATPTSLTDELQRQMSNFIDGAKSLATAPLPNRIRKDIFAPPGKLGIIIDTCSEGPIVHSVKPTSPLINLIYKGDLVVAVDDEDTVEWSAHYLTKLVAKKSKSERKITVMRIVASGNEDEDEAEVAKQEDVAVDDILNSDA